MNSNKKIWVALVVVAIIAIGGYFFPQVKSLLGAVTPGTRFPHGITIGLPASSPTNISKELTGTCTAATTAAGPILVATSSATFTCTVTGAVTGDIVRVDLPFAGSSAAVWGGFVVSGTSASTDSISFKIFNYTGVATSSFPLATTSVQYRVTSTQ